MEVEERGVLTSFREIVMSGEVLEVPSMKSVEKEGYEGG